MNRRARAKRQMQRVLDHHDMEYATLLAMDGEGETLQVDIRTDPSSSQEIEELLARAIVEEARIRNRSVEEEVRRLIATINNRDEIGGA